VFILNGLVVNIILAPVGPNGAQKPVFYPRKTGTDVPRPTGDGAEKKKSGSRGCRSLDASIPINKVLQKDRHVQKKEVGGSDFADNRS
jgi:hypothetical protein